ncbi:putative ankyrin 2,3/unc44 [Colletotrichum sp. SAR11_59]|nr:putative ankyrin 2,3/unc44 [Colletotrichum sp. SAR11_59]
MPPYHYIRFKSKNQVADDSGALEKTAYLEHFSVHSTHPLAGPLYWCAEKGSAVGCKLLLPYEEDPNVQFQNEVGQDDTHAFWETALSAAVRYGSPEAVKVLLDDDRVDPNIGRTYYIYGHISPLAQACQDNNKEIVQMLVSREDVDVNVVDRGGYNVGLTPFLWARQDAAEMLLRRNDIDVNLMRVGRRPIHHLANLGGSLKALDMLLSKPGIDVNMRSMEQMNYRKYVDARDKDAFEHSRTALMVAAFVGHSEEAALLLQHPQIDLGLQDSMGMTPLMLAAVGYVRYNVKTVKHERVGSIAAAKDVELEHSFQKYAETVQILLRSETARVNARDHRGRTALSFAAMCGIEPKSERYGSTGSGCRGTPAWPNDFDEQLSWGTKKDHFESIVQELLAAPTIDVNVADDQGHTSLDYTKWSMEVICQEEHLRLREFDEAIQEAKLEGREPVMSRDEVTAPVIELLYSVTRVQALLIASGAQSGKPILVPAIIEDGRACPVFRMRPVKP